MVYTRVGRDTMIDAYQRGRKAWEQSICQSFAMKNTKAPQPRVLFLIQGSFLRWRK